MSIYLNTLDTSSLINYTTINPTSTIPNLNNFFIANIDMPYYDLKPHLTYVSYQNINTDPELRKNMVKYFIEKIISHLDSYDLCKYVISTNVDTRLVQTVQEYEKNDRTCVKSKEAFIIEYFITKDRIKHYIKKYVVKKNINWYDLKQHKSNVLKYIGHKVKKDIKHSLKIF